MHSSLMSLQPHSVFLNTLNSTWCGTGGGSGPWNTLYSCTHLLGFCCSASAYSRIKQSAEWVILCLGSPPELLENSPSYLAAGEAPITSHYCKTTPLSLLLLPVYEFLDSPLLSAYPLLFPGVTLPLLPPAYWFSVSLNLSLLYSAMFPLLPPYLSNK